LSAFVLDASGLLAYLQDEAGAGEVAEVLARGAAIGAANLAEVLSKIAEHGGEPRDLLRTLEEQGLLGGLLQVEPLTAEDSARIGELRPLTRDYGLGLGDRACLALALRLRVPVMTADRVWAELEGIVDGLQVYAFRT
jgi:ribonuclease VapC